MRSCRRAATKVRVFQWPCGTLAMSLAPRAAHPLSGAMLVFVHGDIPFAAAVVDLCVVDGNASRLIPVLSERGIPVVITTGADVDLGHPALSKATVVLQKPHADSDLIEAIVNPRPKPGPISKPC